MHSILILSTSVSVHIIPDNTWLKLINVKTIWHKNDRVYSLLDMNNFITMNNTYMATKNSYKIKLENINIFVILLHNMLIVREYRTM